MSRALPSRHRKMLGYLREIGYPELRRDKLVEAEAEVPPGTVAGSAAADPDSGERRRELEEVAAQAAACERCALAQGRKSVVFGSGDPNARLMLIGEGPGAQEDIQGLPFVGPAGELLTKIIQAIGYQREQVYIANIVKCRPPQNRDPKPEESAECKAFLEAQVRLVQPEVIVALGRVAAQTLLENDLALGRMRGAWYRLRDVPMMVTYHPAALLRNVALKRPLWEDMQQVRDRLAEDRSR